MLPDLEQLIRLQQLENAATEARERIAGLPARKKALDDRIASCRTDLENAKKKLTEHRTARAAIEKDVAEVQSRLSRYKDQLMAVKTNKEYHAMQSEIANAEREVRELEDRLLERMMESDELAEGVTGAEQRLAEEEQAVRDELATIDGERKDLEQKLSGFDTTREEINAQISPAARTLFDTVARGRKGVAVAEARQGLCTSCQVRLRPQLFNDVRTNSALIQCENCQRVLYFAEQRHSDAGAPPPA